MRELLDTLATWDAEGVQPGRAVVVRSFGSAPRPEGAVLLAAPDGRLAGSVSGGCVEGAALRGDRARPRDGPVAGHPLWHQRRAGVGRRPGLWRHDRRPGRTVAPSESVRRPSPASAAGWGGGRHAAARRTRRRPTFGSHEPGDGAPPEPRLVVHR